MKQRAAKILALLLALLMMLSSLAGCASVGPAGPQGATGQDGASGETGMSAYEMAVERGYTGTVEEWIASLSGADGKSAYQLAVEKGYTGTVDDWLSSLVGENGRSAYEIAVQNGFVGSESAWLASLVGAQGPKGDKGDKGDTGEQGAPGAAGIGVSDAYINNAYHLILVMTDGSEIDAGYVGVSSGPTGTSRAQWVALLVDEAAYELVELPTTPTFTDISGHEYEQQIETAAYYALIDTTAATFMPDELITREFATASAIKAMGYIPGDDIECDDVADIAEPEYAQLALDLELVALKDGSFCPVDVLMASEEAKIIEVLTETLNSISAPTGEEEGFVYNEGVVSLSSPAPTPSVNDLSGGVPEEPNSLVQYAEDGRLKLPLMPATQNLQPDQIITIDDQYAFKVVNATVEGEFVLVEFVDPEIFEVLERIDVAGTANADITGFEPADGVVVLNTPVQDLVSGGGEIGIPENPLNLELEISLPRDFKLKVKINWSVVSAEYKYDIRFGFFSVNVKNAYVIFDNKVDVEIAIVKGTEEVTALDGVNPPAKIPLGTLPFVGTGNVGIVAEVSLVASAEGGFKFEFEVAGSLGGQIVNNVARKVDTMKFTRKDVGFAGELKVGPQLKVAARIFKWDLVSLTANFGVAVSGSAVMRSNGMICMDIGTWYVYFDLKLMDETVVNDWFNCAVTVEILGNNEKNPYRVQGIHMENGFNIVSECTYSEPGTITGVVVNASTHAPIVGAKIEVYDYIHGELFTDPFYSDSEGEYSLNTDDGTYKVRVSANGYIPFETVQIVRSGDIVYVEALLMVEGEEDDDRTGTIGGSITNAVTGYAVPGVTLTIRRGWNKTSGTVETTVTTNSNGTYQVSLPLGNYTILMEKDDYVSNHFNVAVTASSNLNLGASIVPTGTAEIPTGDLRIVLRWGATPSDLDSHLTGPAATGSSRFHIFYSQKTYNYNSQKYADLDVDDISSYGPETVTVYRKNNSGTYSYYVHDFTNKGSSNSRALSNSGAYVQVYIGSQQVAVYHVPTGRTGTLWHVFDYNAATGVLTSVNTFSNQSSAGNVGQ